ncbi:HET-domain-containing protein, partial [Cadophora sp. DSE1049]
LMKMWLADCDQNHKCSAKKLAQRIPLPTRLLFIGDDSNLSVKLVSKAQDCDLDYVALSYRWKYLGDEKPLLLTDKNKEEFERAIELNKMPQTFQDAVKVTRGLGVQYLWIDSLCIIQGNKDDWNKESQRMKDVYNGAYCTISATCAQSTHGGFLQKRPERRFIGVDTITPSGKEARIYICEAIDNFEEEVEKAKLHKRGWIFQERALSRRTLHFAKNQAYLECGDGICSETMTKLFKRESFFFSDANFPEQALEFHKGMKIKYYETIYQKYSKLNFSNPEDRAVAMEGLESKILEAYQSGGQFGLLHNHFERSIMWQRPGKDPMKLIEHSNMEKIPSLSWMKVKGAIKYL